jgi:hypothetical protein
MVATSSGRERERERWFFNIDIGSLCLSSLEEQNLVACLDSTTTPRISSSMSPRSAPSTSASIRCTLGDALGAKLGDVLGEWLGAVLGYNLGVELGKSIGRRYTWRIHLVPLSGNHWVWSLVKNYLVGDSPGLELGVELGEALGAAKSVNDPNGHYDYPNGCPNFIDKLWNNLPVICPNNT